MDIFEKVSLFPYISLYDFAAIMTLVRKCNHHLVPNFWQCYRTEEPTIINLRDCRRGFHFRAIFYIANVMPPADRCSISRLAVQFQFGLFGGFGDPVEVTLRRLLPS